MVPYRDAGILPLAVVVAVVVVVARPKLTSYNNSATHHSLGFFVLPCVSVLSFYLQSRKTSVVSRFKQTNHVSIRSPEDGHLAVGRILNGSV